MPREIPLYPQLYKLLSLVIILPITSASAERTFSALKIIKNRLRSKMGDSWLVDCITINVEKEIAKSLKKEDIIKFWENMSSRRYSCL